MARNSVHCSDRRLSVTVPFCLWDFVVSISSVQLGCNRFLALKKRVRDVIEGEADIIFRTSAEVPGGIEREVQGIFVGGSICSS
jgi:hypothetical protein